MASSSHNELNLEAQMSQQTQSPDRKVHGANMGPIWGRQDPGGPHVGPMNFAIWVIIPLGNGMLPIQHQVIITQTNADLLSIGHHVNKH